ncbi:MAG: hypothetical protein AAGA76_16015 [Pseudomonadota bacterium]
MDRRSFLKSIGAAGLLPALPIPSIAIATPSVAPAVSAHTYQWAEMIVRAHNKCNLGMLQRLLQIDNATATVLKKQLLENGIISAQANAYGMHTAIKPLYEGAFVNVSDTASKTVETASDFVEQITDNEEDFAENDPEFRDLDETGESELEAENASVETDPDNENLTDISSPEA